MDIDSRGCNAPRIIAMLCALLVAVLSPSPCLARVIWSLEEHQPDIPQGGRANTIAVNPLNNSIMLVASESGGLFQTADRGVTWVHVESFKPYATGAVVYLPSRPDIVIATAGADFAVANGGGIWRSTDGGANWTQIPPPSAPAGASERFGAGEISIAPDSGRIYVATAYGLSFSDDLGVSWDVSTPFDGQRASSVLALSGNRVLAGHPWRGVRRSLDGGSTWLTPATGAGGVADMHAFGRSPSASDTAYVVNADTQLYVTENAGDTWMPIASAPTGGGGCGGIGFVKASVWRVSSRSGLRLYFGNRCQLYSQRPARIAGTNRYDYSGAWTMATIDHADTRDLAFTRSTSRFGPGPLLLATDGGLHRTADGGATWTFTGGGANGYNALQVTEVKGQWLDDIDRYDLYFGTQDNNNWASTDLGASWPSSVCCEGFFFEMLKRTTVANSQVNFVSCGACGNLFSGAAFASLSNWNNPPGAVVGNPTIVARSFHIQGVNNEAGFARGFAATRSLGASWRQYATFPEDRRDIPRLSQRRMLNRFNVPVHYQSIRTGWDADRSIEINRLLRMTKAIRSDTASVYYPAMNGFGGLGINPTMFAWYQVFGVDPTNSRYLIAPDVVNEKMMQSSDGGDNWTDMPALTALVTDGGRYRFRESIFPHASAVSYYRDDPNLIGVGTHQNGLILSFDHGTTWSKVPGSERATYITSIEWRSTTEAYVSTYGRGLWRLQGRLWIPRFEPLCEIVGCVIRYIDRGDPPPFDRGIVIFQGRLTGVRVEQGAVREVFVTPGSSIGFLAGQGDAPKIKITESSKTVGVLGDVPGLYDWKAWSGPGAFAIALDKSDRMLGLATAKTMLPIKAAIETPPRDDKEIDMPVRSESPTANQSYISLSSSGGYDAIFGGERMVVAGLRLGEKRSVEILIDDRSVGKAVSDGKGNLSFTTEAPKQLGIHSLVIRDAGTGKVIDGMMFIVRHRDEEESRQGETIKPR
jgi:hypothetical protein